MDGRGAGLRRRRDPSSRGSRGTSTAGSPCPRDIPRSGSGNRRVFRRTIAREPFANFFFGGFGNNYVDHDDEKRYRETYAFPGAELNEIGGRNFLKSTVELNLPPLRFQRARHAWLLRSPGCGRRCS